MKIEKQSPENLQIELEDRLLCSAQINDESGIKSNVGTLKTPDLLSVNHVPTSQQLVTAIKSRNSERVKTFLFTAVDASTAALIGNAVEMLDPTSRSMKPRLGAARDSQGGLRETRMEKRGKVLRATNAGRLQWSIETMFTLPNTITPWPCTTLSRRT